MKLSIQERLALKQFFKDRGVTQAKLAVLTGAYRQNVGAWLNGDGCLGEKIRQQIIEYAETLKAQEADSEHQSSD